jgi:ABC-type multidrug transport system fused ATPase/permease subunit
VITIAHRLNTVLDYDQIVVLAAGQIQEYDTPHNLLSDKDSQFYSMCKDADLV